MNAIVTGGAGFIGSNLANALNADGHDVYVLDDLSLGTPDNLDDGIEMYGADVAKQHWDFGFEVDVVFHLAALSSLTMHQDDPQRGARVNVEGFVNTVEKARKSGCDTVVYASTSSIYAGGSLPSPSDQPVTARTAYEASKLARERYAEFYQHEHDIDMCGLRFFSVYQGYEGNEEHKGEYANVISQFAAKMKDGEQPVLFGDGEQTRDFTHVSDVVQALRDAVGENGVYNVGTGESYTFNEVVQILNDELGTDIEPEHIENPIDEDIYVDETLADCSRFEALTGWSPEIQLSEGVTRL